jgi:antitoxin Phd
MAIVSACILDALTAAAWGNFGTPLRFREGARPGATAAFARRLRAARRKDQIEHILVGLDRIGIMMAAWQVQQAKTRLSEVIERARTEGPQTITRHGAERAVVLSIEDYRALVAHKPDFKAHLLGGPKIDDFTIERDRDTGRDVEL